MRAFDVYPGLPAVDAARLAHSPAAAEAHPLLTSTSALSPATVLHLQRAVGNAGVGELLEEARSPVHDVVGSGGGSPLESGTRQIMEERLGGDFTDVRVHTGTQADTSARSIQALAYTVGNDVVFRSGQYAPDTPSGQHVLAHELTHVVQQREGPVDGTPAAGGIRLSDPSDRFEQAAERAATDAIGPPASVQPAVQREGEEEEELEAAQALLAQRLGEEEEEEPAPA